jgi:hypothetical protein
LLSRIWSDQFDHSFTDIFNTQDAISEQVVRALQVELTGEEQRRLTLQETDNSEALDLLERGLRERAAWMVFLRVEPCFDALRSELRFRTLVQALWD